MAIRWSSPSFVLTGAAYRLSLVEWWVRSMFKRRGRSRRQKNEKNSFLCFFFFFCKNISRFLRSFWVKREMFLLNCVIFSF